MKGMLRYLCYRHRTPDYGNSEGEMLGSNITGMGLSMIERSGALRGGKRPSCQLSAGKHRPKRKSDRKATSLKQRHAVRVM